MDNCGGSEARGRVEDCEAGWFPGSWMLSSREGFEEVVGKSVGEVEAEDLVGPVLWS